MWVGKQTTLAAFEFRPIKLKYCCLLQLFFPLLIKSLSVYHLGLPFPYSHKWRQPPMQIWWPDTSLFRWLAPFSCGEAKRPRVENAFYGGF
ncbi:hypothetical protein ES332_A08G293200v1 [Gossypium tomentosum]|uniref:Uncharacterized protein n=1 Tax=Gossypium tomentosum TaxID=34277 RepID=A0A5D2PP23_GOSTO|nr:hypothetical protein ES332_A08G293200v1 [Gossypium tomentosum]